MTPCPEAPLEWWRWIDDGAPLLIYVLTLYAYRRIADMRYSFPQWVATWRWHAAAVCTYALGRLVVIAQAAGVEIPYGFQVRNWLVVLAAACLWQGANSMRRVLKDAGAAR